MKVFLNKCNITESVSTDLSRSRISPFIIMLYIESKSKFIFIVPKKANKFDDLFHRDDNVILRKIQ